MNSDQTIAVLSLVAAVVIWWVVWIYTVKR